MDPNPLKLDPAVDVIAYRGDRIVFLTPDGSFTIRDRQGLARKVSEHLRIGKSPRDLLAHLEDDFERAAASELIDLLRARGVVSLAQALPPVRSPEPLRDWVRHHAGVTDRAVLSVSVSGGGTLARAIRAGLVDAGIQSRSDDELRIIALDTPDFPELLKANEAAILAGARFLPVWLNRSTLHLGPSVIPGVTACVACLLHRQQAARWRCEPVETALIDGVSISPALVATAAAMTLTEALRALLDAHVNTDFGVAYQFDMLSFRLTSGKVARLPFCVSCDRAHGRL